MSVRYPRPWKATARLPRRRVKVRLESGRIVWRWVGKEKPDKRRPCRSWHL